MFIDTLARKNGLLNILLSYNETEKGRTVSAKYM